MPDRRVTSTYGNGFDSLVVYHAVAQVALRIVRLRVYS